MMEQTLREKKNKHNITKLNSIISQYEAKLDNRVNQVVSEILNYTKKCNDPVLLPIIHPKKPANNSANKQSLKERNKSLSYNTNFSFQGDEAYDAEMEQLRETFKNLDSTKVLQEGGRSIGNHPFIRPKFVKKKPEILPKEIRLNPFHERNAIKAHQLEKGLLSLIQKGKIGKDVNIITAFQKGRPVLQAQKAIFHQGEERFAELDSDKNELKNSREKNVQKGSKQQNKQFRQKNFEENWAITMPKDEDKNIAKHFLLTQQKSRVEVTYKEHIYLKLMNYEVIKDQNYKQFITKHLQYKGEIIQILQKIGSLMFAYSIDIGFADSSKILEYVTKVSKLSKDQVLSCLVNKNNNLLSLKSVRNIERKRDLALDRVASCLKFYMERKGFLKFLKKKKIANKIYGWAVSCWTVKKRIQEVKLRRKQIQDHHAELQQTFAERYTKILEERHYQIHVINQSIQGKQAYKEYLNIQITRIFNLRNPNKYIIYLLHAPLDEETINYYYKIMQLEEIPNYKERVSFIEVDPHMYFTNKINISTKLYYNSKTIRRLKKKIKDFSAYFVTSYPTLVDVKLSSYLNIPILGGNLLTSLEVQKRTSLNMFKYQLLQQMIIDKSIVPHNLTALSDDIIAYCQTIKRKKQFIIKINGRYRSKGTALLSYPFLSLPEMYENTNIISEGLTVDEFYRLLLKEGGVLQVYQEEVYPIVGVINIAINGDITFIGSFEKLSSGFINIGYTFPQRKIENKWLIQGCKKVGMKLFEEGHFGDAEITFYVDGSKALHLQKVQCYLTHLGSSLFYYRFLSEGQFNQNGDYMAKIIDTFEKQEGVEEQIVTLEPRSFCYIPYLLHFGLSERQINSFFQLCRMGGVSFDLQNKYGATFILLGSLKTSMGLITTAKDRKGAMKLMLKSLEFILKQNSHNMSNQTLIDKQIRMKERENILNIKERLEDL